LNKRNKGTEGTQEEVTKELELNLKGRGEKKYYFRKKERRLVVVLGWKGVMQRAGESFPEETFPRKDGNLRTRLEGPPRKKG